MKGNVLLIVLIFISLLGLGFLFREKLFFSPRPTKPTSVQEALSPKIQKSAEKKAVEIIAQNLSIPWEIAFLPKGDMLVTERGGKLLKVGSETKVIKEIEGVKHVGEGGLLGMALHPKFSTNGFV